MYTGDTVVTHLSDVWNDTRGQDDENSTHWRPFSESENPVKDVYTLPRDRASNHPSPSDRSTCSGTFPLPHRPHLVSQPWRLNLQITTRWTDARPSTDLTPLHRLVPSRPTPVFRPKLKSFSLAETDFSGRDRHLQTSWREPRNGPDTWSLITYPWLQEVSTGSRPLYMSHPSLFTSQESCLDTLPDSEPFETDSTLLPQLPYTTPTWCPHNPISVPSWKGSRRLC